MTDDRDDKPDNVVAFLSLKEMRDSGGPVTRKPRDHSCYHAMYGVLIDEEPRIVTCRQCGKPVDAFDALATLAARWDWSNTQRVKKDAEDEATKVLADLDKLKSARSRLKSSSSVKWSAVTKTLTALDLRLEKEAAACRGADNKAGAIALTGFRMWLRVAREELSQCVTDPGRLDKVPEVPSAGV